MFEKYSNKHSENVDVQTLVPTANKATRNRYFRGRHHNEEYQSTKMGNFNSIDELVVALKEFSLKTDKEGFGIPYKNFSTEHKCDFDYIRNVAAKRGFTKLVPRKKGKHGSSLFKYGGFTSYGEFVQELKKFCEQKEDGKSLSYTVFAKKYNLPTTYVCQAAKYNGFTKL